SRGGAPAAPRTPGPARSAARCRHSDDSRRNQSWPDSSMAREESASTPSHLQDIPILQRAAGLVPILPPAASAASVTVVCGLTLPRRELDFPVLCGIVWLGSSAGQSAALIMLRSAVR